MKKLYRRSISGLLALLICFTAILGSGMTAYAAAFTGETADSYSVAFPRDGDANLDYSGTWGHDELHYMNGWTSGEATWMTTLHTIGSFDGPACYCIEPGVPRNLYRSYESYGEDYWDTFPAEYNRTIDGRTMKTLLGRIMQYGYQGNLSLDWRSQNEADADKLAHMMATQVLVWETVVGERDADFNHVDPGSADAVKSVYRTSHPLYTIKGGYRLPDLLPPQEPETALGKYGLLRRKYLKEHRKVLFTNLLTSGKLNEHLAEIDRTARQRVEQTVTAMAQAEGVTEELKAADPMKWVRLMSNLRNAAEETVLAELIYS